MVQLFLAVLATVVSVVFVMANTHHVQLSFALGAPVQVRLISLVVAAYAAGLLTAWFHVMVARAKHKAEQRRQRALATKRAAAAQMEAE